MNGYMLDTNVVSALIQNPTGPVARRLERSDPSRICTSIIVAAELRYGCVRKGSANLAARLEAILAIVPVLPLDAPADEAYGTIRAELEAAGQTIGPNDLLIAAHARALGLSLVTNNVKEFRRVRGLKVENWLQA